MEGMEDMEGANLLHLHSPRHMNHEKCCQFNGGNSVSTKTCHEYQMKNNLNILKNAEEET